MRRRSWATTLGLIAGLGIPAGATAVEPPALLPRPGLQALQTQSVDPVAPLGESPSAPKSIYRAALYSAVLPGLGEAYSGHTTRAFLSGGAEAAIWISYATFKVQEDVRGERAIEYAVANASAVANGDDDYFKAVGLYDRAEGPGMWNEYVRRKARDEGEVVGREYTGDEAWTWTSEAGLLEYRRLRREKLHADDHATSALAFALLNRIVSVVSVVQAVRSDHRAVEKSLGLRFETGGTILQPQAWVGLWNRF